MMHRRMFLSATTAMAASSLVRGAEPEMRKFTMDLCPGRIGVRVGQLEAIELAATHGFESVEPMPAFLASQSRGQLEDLRGKLSGHHLDWGAASAPVEFRQDETRFEEDLKKLPDLAAGLQRAGVTRVGTWLRPAHDELTYLANFRQHTTRLRAVGKLLADHGLRFGLEYVGPRTSWTRQRYAFIHTLAETRELLAAIDVPQVGFVLDSWHWHTAEETVDDLRTLDNQQIVAVDLNDAPAGIPVEEQIDNRRELPSATGVIDLKSFLTVLQELGYDGPIRAEPFNRELNELDDAEAVAATAKAMRRAFDLLS